MKKLTIILIILSSCSLIKDKMKLNKRFLVKIKDVENITIHKYDSNYINYKEIIISDSLNIHLLCERINENNPVTVKFPKKYVLIFNKASKYSDTIMVYENYFKTQNYGGFRMSKNIEPILNSYFDSKPG